MTDALNRFKAEVLGNHACVLHTPTSRETGMASNERKLRASESVFTKS